MLRSFRAEPKIKRILESADKAGLEPQTDIEQTKKIGMLEQLKPYRRPGLSFYSAEGDLED